jgi:homopolymeric O-antigen transport system ATP-binding protein
VTAAGVALEQVSKRYTVGERPGLLSAPWRTRQSVWALRDIDLNVAEGESVGLIGHNGAGKTTLLRLLAGITRPTLGQVKTHGRLASLINLGAGFHPELTGRENIYLNGVILGLSRREVRTRFEQIVEFADLGAYIDTPLKRYSSGMYARLGFAVAAHVDPDVLLVDEVLSVGDVAFQDRSIRKMLSFRDSGRAILFVSHNLSAVEMMCQRTVWLEHGRVRAAGPTADVVRAYLDAVDQGLLAEGGTGQIDGDPAAVSALEVAEVTLRDANGRVTTDFEHGDSLDVQVHCRARRDARDVQLTLTIRGDYGPLFSASSDVYPLWRAGKHEVDCRFEKLPLLPGLYRIEVTLAHAAVAQWSLPHEVAAFRVITDLAEYGSDSVVGATKSRGGFLAVPYDWRIRSAIGEQLLPGLRLPRNMAASRPR